MREIMGLFIDKFSRAENGAVLGEGIRARVLELRDELVQLGGRDEIVRALEEKADPLLLSVDGLAFVELLKQLDAWPHQALEHFVDVIRLSFFSSVGKAPNKRNKKIKFPPSVTQLVAAGVKLRRGETECLFDIEFENGVLKIPCLVLDDWTESYFRNIIAFEQCCYSSNNYLTDYIGFMDQLVDTPGNTELLIDKEIIENWLSNKEAVAQLINNFAKEILLSENYHFSSLSDKLIKHCQRPYNKWKATLKRDYCTNPWVVISVIAAVLLLFEW
ncbi:hypothetical protein NL676_035249 [Syzygium grande]|nr:hypothetical protein NL676_035249 [Syzygium grande]